MTLLLIFSITLLVAVLISALVQRTVLSTAVLFLVVGILAGRGLFGSLALLGTQSLRILAELALFSVLFTDGMRAGSEPAPPGSRALVVRSLAFGMPLTVAGIAALAVYLLGFSWVEGILIGAVLSPTDPIFISAIFRFDAVPARLQRLLNVESGINDGIALPLVVIFLGEMAAQPVSLLQVFLQLTAGIAIGVVIPWLAIRLEAARFLGSAGVLRSLHAFAIGLLVLAVSWRLDANIFLAAFAAGVSVAHLSPDVRDAFHSFGEGVTELLKLAVILIFGLQIAPNLFSPLAGADIAFVLLSLIAVRIVAFEISMLGSALSAAETLAAGWFGPKGFGSVVYGLMILELDTARARAMGHLVGLTIALSIVVYSSTDVLLARWFERRRQRQVVT